MQRFAALYESLDASTRTNDKLAALVRYFSEADAESAAWATWFLTGNKLKRTVKSGTLREAAITASGLQPWLFESSYEVVGDLAETISLLFPDSAIDSAGAKATVALSLAQWIDDRLAPLANATVEEQLTLLPQYWRSVPRGERFLITKLLTGALRVGVSKALTLKALAQARGLDPNTVTQRLMGSWAPGSDFFGRIAETQTGSDLRPYPFLLAYATNDPSAELGDVKDWQVEWKWDGIRAQIVKRDGKAAIWSRGEELVDEAFPDVLANAASLPDGTVLDGELIVWHQGRDAPEPFASLQKRLGRKKPPAKMQSEFPVQLLAYDLLEHAGVDIRNRPLAERRQLLESLLQANVTGIQLSPALTATSWQALTEARQQARDHLAEGLMLKRLASPYGVGRISGDWWKWKVAPLTVDCVMIYAQAGHGRRAGLYTDFTFAVWSAPGETGERTLVPFAKAYSGLTDAELREVDAWIRKNTIERFGPVRSVKPEQVFELGFEGIQASTRHKSGIAVRFPRILRWRHDKPAAEADTLQALQVLIAR
jgi:DNA ligase 1